MCIITTTIIITIIMITTSTIIMTTTIILTIVKLTMAALMKADAQFVSSTICSQKIICLRSEIADGSPAARYSR